MELDITSLFSDESSFVPFDLSNNCATLGDNAGALTWQASLECARSTKPSILDTEEKREAFREFVCDSGGWTREEIDAWSEEELQALCLQWIAGDVREAFGDEPFESWDWKAYEADRNNAGRLFKGKDGKIYFYIGT